MHFRIPLLPMLMAIVTMVASQDGLPVSHAPSTHQSVVYKCASFFGISSSISTPRVDFLPLETLCHPNIDKYFDCTLADIYKSNFRIDIIMRSVTDFGKARAATKAMCREAPKLNKETPFCNVSVPKCRSSFRPTSKIYDVSNSFCKMRENRRCVFKEFAKCDLQKTMLWAKYEHGSQSNGCLVSDSKIQLIPSYGPELKCYSNINIVDTEPTEYRQLFENYCDQFNYSEVSTCIEKTLSNVTSEELWEDKESYINKARQFVNDRRKLCRKLAALPSGKCSNPIYKLRVSECQNMFAYPGPSKRSVPEIVRFYAFCVWLIYLPCDWNLADLIRSNLITYI